jgi:hypothetical protein
MTSSIPQLVDLDPPTEDTSADPAAAAAFDDEAMRQVSAELDKAGAKPRVEVLAGVTQEELDEMSEIERKLNEQRHAMEQARDDPMRMLVELLPKMLETVGLAQECRAIIIAVKAVSDADHKEIHALQARVKNLEAASARRAATEGDDDGIFSIPEVLPSPQVKHD